MKSIFSRAALAFATLLSVNVQAQIFDSIDVACDFAVDASGNVFGSHGGSIFKRTPSGSVTTIAGTGTIGYSGDGGPALAAQIRVENLALDGSGNVYFLDRSGRVRKVSTSGIITTIAGTGTDGYSGDGGPATAAQINAFPVPRGIAADASGNVYFESGYRIRKISTSGTITTIAGTGTLGFSGDGGPATTAQIGVYNSGITVDNLGNLLIADELNGRIRKISSAGIITTIAGAGVMTYSGDGGPATTAGIHAKDVKVDGAGNLYIADESNNRVRKVNVSGTISTIAGTGAMACSGFGGPATAAQIFAPREVGVDGYGNVFISSGRCNTLGKISISANGIETLENFNAFIISPTVNNGAFSIRGTVTDNEALTIEIVTISGQKVYTSIVKAQEGRIDHKIVLDDNLPAGMYLLTLRSASATRSEKFIITR